MEPKLPAPYLSPETGVSNPQVLPPRPEVLSGQPSNTTPERPAVQERQSADSAQATPQFATIPQPSVTSLAAPATPVLSPLPTDNNPVAAGDDEVIEKEWVDKAKKIVATTKDDPYIQEKEVSKLQADYIKKRYGKEIKLTSD